MEEQQHQHPGGKGASATAGQGAIEGPAPKDTDLDEIREKFRIVKVRVPCCRCRVCLDSGRDVQAVIELCSEWHQDNTAACTGKFQGLVGCVGTRVSQAQCQSARLIAEHTL